MSKECPLCARGMVEEEGLLWCDSCGINEDSSSYHEAKEMEERYKKEYYKDFHDE